MTDQPMACFHYYILFVANLDELRRQDMEERELYKVAIQEYKERCEEKQERVNEERDKFMEFKKLIALNAVNSRSGKPISPKVNNTSHWN